MNFSYEIEKIKPIDISDTEFNKNAIPDNVRKSIALYNRAIANLKITCADLAIIDLKRSLSLNPGFGEAIRLLGLCYVYKNDFNKAESVFKKLSKDNTYTMIANDYLKELNVERATLKATDVKGNFDSDNNIKSNTISKLPRCEGKIKKISSFPKKLAVVSLVSTIIIAILGVVYWTHLNTQIISNKVENSEVKKNKELEQKKIKNETYAKVDEITKKNLDNTKLEQENYKNKNDIIIKLDDAEKFYEDGNYEKSIDNLLILKTLTLDDTAKSRFDTLLSEIKTKAVWNIYNQGSKLYKEGKYQEALPKLIKVQEISPELDIAPWVSYQIANCYKETKDNKNALVLFEKVKKNYPNSNYANYSESMISEINGK